MRGELPEGLQEAQAAARDAAAQVRALRASDSERRGETTEGEESHRVTYVESCSDCGSPLYLDSRRAELVCSSCGLVAADTLILHPERESETYPPETDDSRILPQLYFGTVDAFGRPVDQNLIWILKRTAQTYNLRSSERSAVTQETRIRRLAAQLNIPSTIATRAIYLLRKATRQQVIRKPGLNDYALALLLAACRESRFVITIEDLVSGGETDGRKSFQRSKSIVRRYYNTIKQALNLQIRPPSTENYITYFAGKLGIADMDIISTALGISRAHANPNSTPHCVAAGALYIAMRQAGRKTSQKAFCKEANLSEISLRNWVAQLGGISDEKNVELPPPDLSEMDSGELDEEKHPKSEQRGDDERSEPSPPQETERKDSDTDDGESETDDRDALKKVRNRGDGNVRRTVEHRPKAHKKATYRKDTPVKRHRSRPPRRVLRPRSRARSRVR